MHYLEEGNSWFEVTERKRERSRTSKAHIAAGQLKPAALTAKAAQNLLQNSARNQMTLRQL